VKLLLKKGAEPDSKDDDYGQTPLSRAAGNGHEAVVKLLLEKDAELESKDSTELVAHVRWLCLQSTSSLSMIPSEVLWERMLQRVEGEQLENGDDANLGWQSGE
jgi:ankyrin repeat protein